MRYCQVGILPKEMSVWFVHVLYFVKCVNSECLAGTFTVVGSDDGCLNVDELVLLRDELQPCRQIWTRQSIDVVLTLK